MKKYGKLTSLSQVYFIPPGKCQYAFNTINFNWPVGRPSCGGLCQSPRARSFWGRSWTGSDTTRQGLTPRASSRGIFGSPEDQYPEWERLVLRQLRWIEWSSARLKRQQTVLDHAIKEKESVSGDQTLIPENRKTFQHNCFANAGAECLVGAIKLIVPGELIKFLCNCDVKVT